MTAHLYWDHVWRTANGRAAWSNPHPWVAGSVDRLRALGVRDVIDLGCGVGRHTLFLAEQGFRVHAADRSAEAVEFVRAAADEQGLDVSLDVADFHTLPYRPASADLVLAFNVVYHTDEDGLARALAEIRRVLRPGGIYQSTMLSKRNAEYGRGTEIRPNTFVRPDADDDKVHPHLYVDAADLVRLHQGFQLLSAFDEEQGTPGSYHWYCRFELDSGEQV